MAKDFPYFKFYCSEWDNGNVTLCSFEAQGLFINLCSLYWQKEGKLNVDLAEEKLLNKSKNACQELLKRKIFRVRKKMVVIKFLDELLAETAKTSSKRSESAKERWSKSNASAMQMHSKSNANGMQYRGEERKEDDSIVEPPTPTIAEYGDKTSKYFVLINPPYLNSRKYRLWGVKGVEEFLEANSSQLNRKEHAEKFLREKHGVPFNDMGHLINSYNAFIDKQFK